MLIPEAFVCADTLPETECLALFPGAVIGSPYDPAAEMLRAAGITLSSGAPVREFTAKSIPAGHVLAAAAVPLSTDDPAGVELFSNRLLESVRLADNLGVKEFSLLSLPTEKYDSRLFSFNTVLFRVLMQEREDHPSLERIRFFCQTATDADWLSRVYNFYYPAEKSERMSAPVQYRKL